jgi:triphosphoribosyl-dephospho-CoA synthase
MISQAELPLRLAAAFKNACLSELEALKPGNVHIFSDGHGMVVQDFVRSAEAAAEEIAKQDLTIGQRIHDAVDATWKTVGCNTNLGIVLLCAPLIHAILHGTGRTLRARLAEVLENLTVADAELAFQAILQASPAGLGKSEHHDVHEAPQVTLLQAMSAASARDRIARQYANGYEDVFAGAEIYRATLHRWGWTAWATTAVYLRFLANISDTHLIRKYGEEVALQVRSEAAEHERNLLMQENPKKYQRPLLDFDRDLKARGLNPGTSADLTVASLLVVELENMVTDFVSS